MKTKLFLSILFLLSCQFLLAQESENFASYVDPFIGTGGHGHTYPGAVVPFGMIQASPDTRLEGWDGCSGYHYSDDSIYGFSQTHLSGTGCSDYGDILLMPVPKNFFPGGKFNTIQTTATGFSHANEIAKPGYYSVTLDNGIKVEITVTERSAVYNIQFGTNVTPQLIVDLKHRDKVLESFLKIESGNAISGFRRSQAWAQDQHVFFYADFSMRFKETNFYQDDKLLKEKIEFNGKNLKCALSFLGGNPILTVRIGISQVSAEGAKANLLAEQKYREFEVIQKEAEGKWNDYLGKIKIKTSDASIRTNFYTCLYHTAVAPNLASDVDGQYRGRDLKIHKTDGWNYYTVFSLWDTFRALHPLLTILEPDRTKDFVRTFLVQYEPGGRLPIWELSSNETNCMIGYHAVSVIADAYAKGIKLENPSALLKAMMSAANDSVFGLPAYKKYGFIPSGVEPEDVSRTLEYAYDDWCIYQFAKLSNQLLTPGIEEFEKRASSFYQLFDPQTGFMRARVNGGWQTPFDPKEVNFHYTEGNAWQYTFFVPQDPVLLLNLYGGSNGLERKLDEMFNADSKTTGREQADITGLIGQYAHGNEPSHHIAYLYNYTNAPQKGQAILQKIMTEMYKPTPDGLCGNEDCGQMSAWYVFSALGFYPFCPGTSEYQIGFPMVDEAEINSGSGINFKIKVFKQGTNNSVIRIVKESNKISFDNIQITDSILHSGRTIEFLLGDKNEPVGKWGQKNTTPSKYLVQTPWIEGKTTFTDSTIVRFQPAGDEHTLFAYTFEYPKTNPNWNTGESVTIKDNCTMSFFYIRHDHENGSHDEVDSEMNQAVFTKVIGGRSIQLDTVPNPQYPGTGELTLLDGIFGGADFRAPGWQGWYGPDFSAQIDLGKNIPIKEIKANFLQNADVWIWFPSKIEISISSDGKNFKKILEEINPVSPKDMQVQTRQFGGTLQNQNARYIRIKASNPGKIQDWHPGVGNPSWLFIDEITVE